MSLGIPSGWREVELRDLLSESDERVGERSDLPLLSVTKYDGAVLARDRFSRVLASKDLSRYRVAPRDAIVIDPMLLWDGVIALQHQFAEGVVSPDYRVFRFTSDTDPQFFDYLAHATVMRRQYARAARGTNVRRRRISRDDFLAIRVVVPPGREQREIASKIKVAHDAIAAGEAVVEQVRRIRRDMIEALVGSPLHPSACVSELGTVSYGLTVDGERRKASNVAPYLTVANVGAEGDFDLGTVKEVGTLEKDTRYVLEPGDVLVIEGNANPKRIGVAAIWRGVLQGVLHQNHLMRIRPDSTRIDPAWLCYALATKWCRDQIEGHAKTTSGLHTINSSVLGAVRVPLPGLAEQQDTVARLSAVEARLRAEREVLAHRQRLTAALADGLLSGRLRNREAA